MRPVVGWPIAIILSLLAVGAYLNGEAVNNLVEEYSITIGEEEEE